MAPALVDVVTTRIGPQPGKQTMFLASPAAITIYGGMRGGGKSFGLLLDPLRHLRNAGFRGIYFRRTTKDLTKGGGLWDKSHEIYPRVGARARQLPNLDWTFPSGAQLQFSHMERERDKENHRGNQYAAIYFDELPHFTRSQFFFLLTCNRSTCGVQPYMLATCNPGPGWVKDLIRWWLDDEGRFARDDRAGVVRWFVRGGNDELVWADSTDELQQLRPQAFLDPKTGASLPAEAVALSLTFIPASLDDNQALVKADPGYRAKLAQQSLVDRKRSLEGDWAIRESAGTMFRSSWYPIVDVVEPYIRIVRYWDLAGSKRRRSDFLAGTKRALHADGTYTVIDVKNEQLTPLGVEKLMHDTAVDDGVECEVHIEQETGASGELLIDAYARGPLRGFTVIGHSVRSQGTKVDRARPASSAAEKGHVKLLRAHWNEPYLEQHEAFPEGDYDDIVDSDSGSHAALQEGDFAFASGSMGGARR